MLHTVLSLSLPLSRLSPIPTFISFLPSLSLSLLLLLQPPAFLSVFHPRSNFFPGRPHHPRMRAPRRVPESMPSWPQKRNCFDNDSQIGPFPLFLSNSAKRRRRRPRWNRRERSQTDRSAAQRHSPVSVQEELEARLILVIYPQVKE